MGQEANNMGFQNSIITHTHTSVCTHEYIHAYHLCLHWYAIERKFSLKTLVLAKSSGNILFFPYGYPQKFFLTVLGAFTSTLQKLEPIAKRESHLRKCSYQVGLCTDLWCIFLMILVGRPSSLCSATPGLVVRGSVRKPDEQAMESKPKQLLGLNLL